MNDPTFAMPPGVSHITTKVGPIWGQLTKAEVQQLLGHPECFGWSWGPIPGYQWHSVLTIHTYPKKADSQ
jgi:hypothetical protein